MSERILRRVNRLWLEQTGVENTEKMKEVKASMSVFHWPYKPWKIHILTHLPANRKLSVKIGLAIIQIGYFLLYKYS